MDSLLVKTIVLQDCIVRGDLAGVKIGRHCIIGERVVIRPPFKKFQAGYSLFSLIFRFLLLILECNNNIQAWLSFPYT
jgi:hypothetical protein